MPAGSTSADVAVPDAFAAFTTTPSQEFDLQLLLGGVGEALTKKSPTSLLAPQVATAAIQPFPFGVDMDSMFNVDFTGSFLSSAPVASSSSAAQQLPYEGSIASSEEWFEEFEFDDQSLMGLGGGASKRKSGSGSDDGDGTPGTKRARHRPTVQTIRQRQMTQLEKLNARNDELRTTISSVTSDLDQVKRLVCMLLKKRLAEKKL